MEYVVSLADTSTREDLHKAISSAIPLPEYYGGNLDALHDVLTDISEPTRIIFTDYKAAKKSLGNYFYSFREAAEDSEKENPNLTVDWRRKYKA